MRAFSIVIPVRSSDTELLRRNLPSWKALGSDDILLCTNGKFEPEVSQGCRIIDSTEAEQGWFWHQGGARRQGFLNAKNDIILTGDIDVTVTPDCLKAVELIQGDVGVVSLEKRREVPGLQEAVRQFSKKMAKRVRHRVFFSGLYVLNRKAWIDTDDMKVSKDFCRATQKGEDILLKESMLRSRWRVVYLPVAGGIDYRIAFEDRPESQFHAAKQAWVQNLSPFTVTVRALIYARPLMMGRYLSYASESGDLGRTLGRTASDGIRIFVRRALKRRARRMKSNSTS